MTRFQTLIAAAAALLAFPALAHDGVHIENAYARTMGVGKSGAVFFEITNHADVDDRLIGVSTEAAAKAELHTHRDKGDGVMQMMHVPEGFPIPALAGHALQRGGDHVMLMGLKQDFKDGDIIHLTLTFEHAGEVLLEAPVDNAKGDDMGQMDHSKMGHGAMSHDMSAMVDTTGMADAEAINAVLQAQFGAPDSPLTVEPVTIDGDNALVGWAQGNTGGRALLARRNGAWEIVLRAGDDLLSAAFLAEHGVPAADTLLQAYTSAEEALGAGKTAFFSGFQGVEMIAPMQ